MNEVIQSYTQEIKALVGRTAQNIVLIGAKLQAVKDALEHGEWTDWLRQEFDWSAPTARRMIQVSERFKTLNVSVMRIDVSALYILAADATPKGAAEEAIALAHQGQAISPTTAKALVHKHRGTQTLHAYNAKKAQRYCCGACDASFDTEVWHCPGCHHHWAADIGECRNCHQDQPMEVAFLPPPARPLPLLADSPPVVAGHRPTFNKTNEMVDWAKWTWNPVTGCLHTCVYCYARDIAERFYPEKFEPTFRPDRLKAPQYTKVPPEAEEQIGYRNVFVCSMADLFGKWVPQEWIDAVLDEVRAAPQWNFLFLTKFPQRLAEIQWPQNAWVGTTVDEQYRVEIAEKAFRKVDAPVKWLSCEPLRERLTFTSLAMFDWVVFGGQSASTQAPAFQPPWEWVEHLWQQARQSQCLVYWKPNLVTRPCEYPGQRGVCPP